MTEAQPRSSSPLSGSGTDSRGSAPVWTPRPGPPALSPRPLEVLLREGVGSSCRVRASPVYLHSGSWVSEVPLLLPAAASRSGLCSPASGRWVPASPGTVTMFLPTPCFSLASQGLRLLGLNSHRVPAHEVMVRHPLARAPPAQRSGNGQNEQDGGEG